MKIFSSFFFETPHSIINNLIMSFMMENLQFIAVESDEDKERRRQREKIEHERSNGAAARWVLGVLAKNATYGERIPLKDDGSFDIPENVTELPLDVAQLVRVANRMEYSKEGLNNLAREVSLEHPELRFSFTIDPQGKWIEYSVKKQGLSLGDEVQWENQGVRQWTKSRKIQSIQKDPNSDRQYAFVEGTSTGIPLDELVLSQGE